MVKRKVKVDGFRVINERIELVPIDSIQPSPENVNQGDLGVVIDSVGRHGFYGCIVAQKSTGYIIAGEFRWRAAQHHGAKQVPVAFVDVDDAEARRMRLVDNRSTRLGTDDPAALATLLQELVCDGGLEGTGYDSEALDELLTDLGQTFTDHQSPQPEITKGDELTKKWGTATGQLWRIGSHQLFIGDSLQATNWERLCADFRPDGICTDPPFETAAPEVIQAMDASGAMCGIVLAGDKLAFGLVHFWDMRLNFIWRHGHARGGPNLNLPLFFHAHCLTLTKSTQVKTGWQRPRTDYGTVFETKEFPKAGEHHQKPVNLFCYMLEGFPWKTVVDPFAGYGTTLLACEQQHRRCYSMEISPKEAAIMLQRCADAGLMAEKLPDPASGNRHSPSLPAKPPHQRRSGASLSFALAGGN